MTTATAQAVGVEVVRTPRARRELRPIIRNMRLSSYCRPRWAARCASGWTAAEPDVRVEGRRAVRFGARSRLLRGATVLANGGSVTVGADSYLARWSVVQSAGGAITIGDRSGIGDFCSIFGQGGLEIGDDVMLASGVRILTAEHVTDRRDVPIRVQGETRARTVIEDDVWIGANAVVLAGVRIGRGAVVAAGAVVTRDVESYAVVAGVPARVLKQRKGGGTEPAVASSAPPPVAVR